MKKKLFSAFIILAFATIFIYLFSVNSSAEQTKNEILDEISKLKQQRQIIQEKIAENKIQIDEVELQISDLMKEIQTLSDKIYRYQIEVAVLEKEIQALDEKVGAVQIDFDEAENKYNTQKEILVTRVVAQYEAGDSYYLDFLLNSTDLVDFISNCYYLNDIFEYDTELIDEYNKQKEEIKRIKEQLDVYKEDLRNKKNDEDKASIVLSNIQVAKNLQVKQLAENEKTLQNSMDQYQKEEQEIEIELLIALTQNLGEEYVGGTLAWPVPGYTTLTSEYGMRIHPISGVYKMHTGIDIGAPTGAYFVAANDGVVVTSVYSASYGNMVMIDHGGGLATLYAHGSERLVEVGDKVKRGEPVLKVGSTGISTGPHAHFEVRINGVWTDPLDYLLDKGNNVQVDETSDNEDVETEN